MGTGKSAVGKRLAKRLNRPFLDLDRKIEKEAGCSVAEIFTKEGEAGFRQRESQQVREVAGLKDHVVATGGGVMLDEENVRILRKSGKIICLTASTEMILQRTLATLPSRPLLAGRDPRSRVEDLLRLRSPFYAQADFAVDTSDSSVEEVVEEILKRVNNES